MKSYASADALMRAVMHRGCYSVTLGTAAALRIRRLLPHFKYCNKTIVASYIALRLLSQSFALSRARLEMQFSSVFFYQFLNVLINHKLNRFFLKFESNCALALIGRSDKELFWAQECNLPQYESSAWRRQTVPRAVPNKSRDTCAAAVTAGQAASSACQK